MAKARIKAWLFPEKSTDFNVDRMLDLSELGLKMVPDILRLIDGLWIDGVRPVPTKINLSGNELSSLDGLHDGILYLDASRNSLISVDSIPSSLETLYLGRGLQPAHSNGFPFKHFEMIAARRIRVWLESQSTRKLVDPVLDLSCLHLRKIPRLPKALSSAVTYYRTISDGKNSYPADIRRPGGALDISRNLIKQWINPGASAAEDDMFTSEVDPIPRGLDYLNAQFNLLTERPPTYPNVVRY